MFFLIFILIFQVIKTDEIKNQTKLESLSDKNRIEDKNHFLNNNDYNEIKVIIEKNFPLLMIRLLSGEEDLGKKLSYFEAKSYNNFSKECKKYKDMCDYGFSINIFIKQKLLIIEIGKESKILIDDSYRQRMTDSIIK